MVRVLYIFNLIQYFFVKGVLFVPIFKEVKQVVSLVDPISREPIEIDEKGYLLLLVDANSDQFENGEFVAMRGRRATFEYLSSSLGNYDILHSYILSGKIALGGEVSVYSFMRLCLEKYFNNEDMGISLNELDDMAFATSVDTEDKINLNMLYVNELNRTN